MILYVDMKAQETESRFMQYMLAYGCIKIEYTLVAELSLYLRKR